MPGSAIDELSSATSRNAVVTGLAWLLSGVLFGAAFVLPGLAFCAWLAVGLLAVALTRTRSSLAVAAALYATQLLARIIAFPWVPDMNRITLELHGRALAWMVLGDYLIWPVGAAVAIAIAHRALHRRLGVWLWLPAAWALGEICRFHLLSLSLDDWLMTQWTVTPVLRGVGHLGWWPTLLVCLTACAAVGQAAATRRARSALPAFAVLLLLALPPLPTSANRALEGVAAIHTSSVVDLPHRPPDGTKLDLVVWPEDARDFVPLLGEGPVRGPHVRPALPGSPAEQLIGMRTRGLLGAEQNQIVVVDASGRIVASRAKQLLMPVAERKIFGIGSDQFVPGSFPPFLRAGGRPVIPLLCSEVMSRKLASEGYARGGRLLAVAARDEMMTTDRALRQLLAVQVMRGVELGIPSLRASFGGRAALVGADGTLLAQSNRHPNGMLFLDRARGAHDVDFWGDEIDGSPAPRRPPPDVAVIYSRATPAMRTLCPEGRCTYHAIEDFECPALPARTVIVAGHAAPPIYLGQPAERVAAAVRCFHPDLVVLDTCYGAATPLLTRLADLGAIVVAAPFRLPDTGLEYAPAFFTASDAAVRSLAVTFGDERLLRGPVTVAALAAVQARVAAMSPEILAAHVVRRRPLQLEVELAGAGPLLIPLDPRRLAAERGKEAAEQALRATRARFRGLMRTVRPGHPAPPN